FDLTVFDDADFIYASRHRAGGVTAIGVGLGRNRRTRFVLSLDANLSTLEGPAIDPANLSLNAGSLCRGAWSECECGCNEKATNNSSIYHSKLRYPKLLGHANLISLRGELLHLKKRREKGGFFTCAAKSSEQR